MIFQDHKLEDSLFLEFQRSRKICTYLLRGKISSEFVVLCLIQLNDYMGFYLDSSMSIPPTPWMLILKDTRDERIRIF
jgi:hypothetical protein